MPASTAILYRKVRLPGLPARPSRLTSRFDMRQDGEDNGPVVLLASHLAAGPSCPRAFAESTGAGTCGDASSGEERSNGVRLVSARRDCCQNMIILTFLKEDYYV